MAIAYITAKDEKEAKVISSLLIKKKFIACSNMFPIKSMFRWNGKMKFENEYAIIAKTSKKKFKLLSKEVRKVHSYELPCILLIESTADNDFEKWAKCEMR